MNARNESEARFIDLHDVMHRTALSKTTVYKLVKQGTFPAPARLPGRNVRWVETEIDDWMQSHLDAR